MAVLVQDLANSLDTFEAGADLSSTAIYSLLMDADDTRELIVTTDKTVNAVGLLWEGATEGLGIKVAVPQVGKVYPMIASAAINFGVEVTPDANGKVVTNDAAAGNFICGICEEASAGDGKLCSVRWQPRTQE